MSNESPNSLKVEKGDVVPAKLLIWRDKFDVGKHTHEWLVQWEGMDISDAKLEEELLLRLRTMLVLEDGVDDRNGLVSKEPLANKENVGPKVSSV